MKLKAVFTPGKWYVKGKVGDGDLSIYGPSMPYNKDGMIAAVRYLGSADERVYGVCKCSLDGVGS